MTSRELMNQTLEFKSPLRVPRQLWELPWANIYYKDSIDAIKRDYPADIGGVAGGEREQPPTSGDAHEVGN